MRRLRQGLSTPKVLMWAGLLGVVFIIGFLVFGGESATTTGARFMTALSTGDTKTLTDLTLLNGRSPEEMKKEWDRTIDRSQHYLFRWFILSETKVDDKKANLIVYVFRNRTNPASYEEKFGLGLERVDGQWKIDVGSMDREMFPALPR